MFSLLIAQASEGGMAGLLYRIDPDLVGVMGILVTALSFVLAIVVVCTISGTIQSITLARMQRNLVREMMAKGYSCQEISMLLDGNKKGILSRLFDGEQKGILNSNLFDSKSLENANGRPVPPVKPRRPVG